MTILMQEKCKNSLTFNERQPERLRAELSSEMCPDVQDFEECDESFSV